MQYNARGLGLAPMLRSHTVRTLDDRVNLIIRLVWDGEAAFNKRHAPEGGLRDPRMRQLGLRVTSLCTARDDMCELNAIHEFVRQNVRYTGDIAMKDLFQSAWRTLQYGGGDCFPEGTRFVTRDGLIPVERILVGQQVHDGTGYVDVLKTWVRGPKTIRRFDLGNGKKLRLSLRHKMLRVPDEGVDEEVRAEDVRVGDALLQPAGRDRLGVLVLGIEDEHVEVPSYDIMTESGRVYLPASDVITRQCDDMAQVAAVLAMENGFSCKFRITSNTGATWDHILCMAGFPKGQNRRWVPLDVTLPRGHAGTHPPMAKYRDFDIDEPR